MSTELVKALFSTPFVVVEMKNGLLSEILLNVLLSDRSFEREI